MLVPTGNTVREQSSAIIQQNLADVGIKVRIQTSDFATVMSECFEGNMDLALLGSAGTVEPHEVSTQFAPGTTTCFSNLQTSEYYDLFQEALEYTSYEERYPIYQEFQELFKEHTPYVTLYSPNMIEAYSKRLSNLDTRDFCQTNFACLLYTSQAFGGIFGGTLDNSRCWHAGILHIQHLVGKLSLVHKETAAVAPESNRHALFKCFLQPAPFFTDNGPGVKDLSLIHI